MAVVLKVRTTTLQAGHELMLHIGETNCNDRESHEKSGDQHPLGPFQIFSSLVQVATVVVLGSQTCINNAQNSCEWKAPAAQNRKEICVFHMLISNINIRFLNCQRCIDSCSIVSLLDCFKNKKLISLNYKSNF